MADIFLKNGIIVSMSKRHGVIKEGNVVIQDNEITAVGKDARPGAEVEYSIDAKNHIVLPGLIQTHVHFVQTLFRGLADDLTLLDWLKKRIWPLEHAMEKEDVYVSSILSIVELLLSGTTSVIDFGSVKHQEEIFRAMREMGIRGKSGKIMMDYDEGGRVDLIEPTNVCISESERLIKSVYGDTLVGYMLTPRFALTSSEELLLKTRELAERYGLGIQTHASENRNEVEIVQNRTGMGNLEYLHSLGLLNDRTVIAHGIWLNETEMWKLKESGATVAHCPSANAKLASGIARVSEMNGYGINVALGSDGAPCNNNLDIFNEMRLSALMQKVSRLDATSLPAKRALKMATVNGARAMGHDRIGVIEEGNLADITLVNLRRPHLTPFTPRHDPYSTLIYAVRGSDVTHVIVNGVLRVMDRGVVGFDMEGFMERVNARAERIIDRSGILL